MWGGAFKHGIGQRGSAVDALGYRKKIGIVVPSTNTVVGPECEDLRPRGVTNHVARLTIKDRPIQASDQGFLAHVQAMREGIGPAIDQVMTCRPDHVIIGRRDRGLHRRCCRRRRLAKGPVGTRGRWDPMGSTDAAAALRRFVPNELRGSTPINRKAMRP